MKILDDLLSTLDMKTSVRGGMGFSFKGSSPPWPYVGRGRGGLPRCAYYTGTSAVTPSPAPAGAVSKEEELNYLKNRVQIVRDDLERINSRIQSLESEKQGGS